MRVLFVSAEAYPLIKTGGLADVSGSLPVALKKLGVEVKLLIPGYPAILEKVTQQKSLGETQVFGHLVCELITGSMPNADLEVIFIKCAELYERNGGPYNNANGQDWQDNPLRFATLSKVASMLSAENVLSKWHPDIVHCNDWQTGLTPYYMRLNPSPTTKSILSIHNLAFQGNFSPNWITTLALDPNDFNMEGYEFYGQLSFLKAGIYYADQLATVSPNYAKEIQTEEFGFGMQGLLKARSADLTGILNGIDAEEWDPEMDPYLPYPYTEKKSCWKSHGEKHVARKIGLKCWAGLSIIRRGKPIHLPKRVRHID